jgi:hypothetical protein
MHALNWLVSGLHYWASIVVAGAVVTELSLRTYNRSGTVSQSHTTRTALTERSALLSLILENLRPTRLR